MRHDVFSYLVFTAVLFLLPVPVVGQEAKKNEEKSDRSAKEKKSPDEKAEGKVPVTQMPPIIVTAKKTEQPLEHITKPVTIIGPEEIESRKAESVSDLLRGVPGLFVSQNGPTGSRTSVLLRGTHPTQTLVLIDGIVVNDPNLGGAYDLSDLDTANIERIEIIRGSQSTLYGSSALGGVINIIMKKGRGKPKLFTETWGGSFSTARILVGGSGGTDNSYWSFAAVTSTTNNDMKHNDHKRQGMFWKYGIILRKGQRLELLARVSESESESPFDYTNPLTFDKNITRKRDQSVLGGKYSHKINRSVSYFVKASFFDVDNFFQNKGDVAGDPDEFTSTAEATVSAFENQWKLDIGQMLGYEENSSRFRDELIIGAEAKKISSLNFTDSPFSSGLGFEDTVDDKAIYIQNESTFSNAFTISLGTRLNKYGDYDSRYLREIGVRYDIKPINLSIKGNYGTGFRAPSPIEFFDPWVGNMNLKPEISKSRDIGVEQSFCKKKLKLSATYFDMFIKDLIAWDSTSGLLENLDKARIKGIEFDFAWKPSKKWSFGLSFTAQDPRDLSDRSKLPFRSPHFGGFKGAYKGKKLHLSLVGYFSEAIPGEDILDEDGRIQPDAGKMSLINFAASYEICKNGELFFKATNLLNDKYKESQREPEGLPFGASIGFKLTF